MKWYEYPLVLVVGIVLFTILAILIGFIFFKFFIILFFIGLVVITIFSSIQIYGVFDKSNQDKEEDFIDRMADELANLNKK